MAVTEKENVNPEIILEDTKPVVDEPEPRPETPRTPDDANDVAARETRDRLMRDRVTAQNEEKRERGQKVGHNICYNQMQKPFVSRSFLALGTEGKNDLYRKILTKSF